MGFPILPVLCDGRGRTPRGTAWLTSHFLIVILNYFENSLLPHRKEEAEHRIMEILVQDNAEQMSRVGARLVARVLNALGPTPPA